MENTTTSSLEIIKQYLLTHQLMMVTAESCTGGGVAKVITDLSGSSQWFERGFVTYSNQAKMDMLGVSSKTLQQFGAVSEETAREMAQGALRHSLGALSIAVTGVAGPAGGTKSKPVGLVWFAWGLPNQQCCSQSQQFTGDRDAIRRQAVAYALSWLAKHLPSF